MKNKPQAIIMGICTVFFVGGFVVFAVLQFQQSGSRSDLRDDGIEAPLLDRSFLEQDERRLNPNTGRFDNYSDDQVIFTFRDASGAEISAAQPIAEDRYDDLGPIGELSALFLADDPEAAELLDNGEFVANAVPYWIFAVITALLAVGAGASAYLSSRPAKR